MTLNLFSKRLINPAFFYRASALLILTMIWITASSQTYYAPGLPYINSLNGTAPAGITLGGTATTTTSDGVQITSATNSQVGYFYMTNTNLTPLNGLHVEFEFSSQPNATSGADGVCMILYNGNGNGTASAFNLGASGAGLGYTYSRTNQNSTSGTQGVANGYLGLGLDEYGNYKSLRSVSNPAEYREGTNISNWVNSGGSHVTLRGPGNSNTSNGGNIGAWYSGYPTLYTTTTVNAGTSSAAYSATLNTSNGNYTTSSTPTVSAANSFTLGTATKTWSPTQADYRKAFIDIVPTSNNYLVIVRIQHGTLMDTIINKFVLPNTSITAIDNAASSPVTNTIATTLPSILNIAFSGSTGAYNNNHYIRSLTLNTPYAAGAQSDTLYVCSNATQPSYTISNILNNDSAYTGTFTTTTSPTASSANINPASFVFSTDSTSVPANFNTILGNLVTATTAAGTWVFNSTTKQVTFTPAAGNTTSAGKIFYSIKSNTSPYSNEAYRSIGASINIVPVTAPSITTTQSTINSSSSRVGSSYNIQIQPVGGGGATYTATGLPAPLKISSTGLISGNAPAQQGYYPFTVTLKNAGGCTASQTYYLTNYATLPVQYSVPLAAVIMGNTVQLSWQTATESNNKYFIVQRSTDQTIWQSIDTVYSFFSNGTGNGHAYSSIDKQPSAGNNFYRLQQVDINGNTAFSSIASVSFGKNSIMYVSPNPANGNIKIYNLPNNAVVRIISVSGSTFTPAISSNGSMNVSNLAPGVYFTQVIVANSIVGTLKFIKQ